MSRERLTHGFSIGYRPPHMSDPEAKPKDQAAATGATLARVSRHIQPLGPRVLVRIVKGPDRSETGLYLPQGVKEEHSAALLGEVVEVARTMPRDASSVNDDDDDRDDDEESRADLGANVSGIPLGSHALFAKDKGTPIPWDDSLRLIEVRHVLAIVDIVTEDELQ